MDFLETAIRDYGYFAIFVVTLFEGETIQIVGGIAAAQAWLKIEWVIVAGFTGTFISDQAVFLIARRYGPQLVARFPRLKRRVDMATPYLERWNTWFILGFRFVYGIRNIAAIAVALSQVPTIRFFWLNMIAAAVWAVTFALVGYIFGHAVRELVGDIKEWILEALILIVVVWIASRYVLKWLNRRRLGRG
jgi:membrane protein DedA with SNARE-associated domain